MWWRKKARQPERQVLRCSFCNRRQDEVRELIAGPRVFICDECVEVCNDILADAERFAARAGRGPRPEEPLTWPNAIRCALCHAEIRIDTGVGVPGNRGTVCIDCVKAVAMARPHDEPSEP